MITEDLAEVGAETADLWPRRLADRVRKGAAAHQALAAAIAAGEPETRLRYLQREADYADRAVWTMRSREDRCGHVGPDVPPYAPFSL